jgi:hypothetical protein
MTITETLMRGLKRGGLELPNGLLVGLSMLGLVAVYNEMETNKLRQQAAEAAAQAEALKALPLDIRSELNQLGSRVCDVVINTRPPFPNNILTGKPGERMLKLEGFKSLLSCAEFLETNPDLPEDKLKAFVISYGNMCAQINDSFESSKTTLGTLLKKRPTPLLHNFYKTLKNTLCQPQVIRRLGEIKTHQSMQGHGGKVESVQELIKKLGVLDEAQKDFPLFKEKKNLGVFCVQALDAVVNDAPTLQTLISYVLKHRSKIDEGTHFPALRSILSEVETKAGVKGKTLEQALTIKPEIVKLALSSICTNDSALAQINEKQRIVFPIFKEMAELLTKDESREARELEVLFLKIFNKVKDF